jgi:osmotically-inducible protein OsmY
MRGKLRFVALGAALVYFFDPENGKRRRKVTMDRIAGLARRHGRRLGRGVASEAYGLKQKATHRQDEPKPQPDDVTLARKVETEIFRGPEVPKGKINVNAENGIVVLRGEAETPEMIEDLARKAREVQGVRDVENLLHVPGALPPARRS